MDKIDVINRLYEVVLHSVESFEEEHIGADLAYLVGAIVKDERCEWPSDRPIVKVLRNALHHTTYGLDAFGEALRYVLARIDVTDESSPTRCPFCGGRELRTELAEWFAVPKEDLDDTQTLTEHQCHGECNGRSFWT